MNASSTFASAGAPALADPHREAVAALDESIVARPLHLARAHVTGRDARRFLQAQLTADIDLLAAGRRICAAWCNPQGRVRAVMLVRETDGAVEIEAPAVQLTELLSTLRRFVLRADVELAAAPAASAHLGFSGPAATAVIAEALGAEPPEEIGAVVAGGGGLACARLAGECRFELFGDEAGLAGVWDRRGAGILAVGTDAWRLTDIVAGFPWLGPATTELHLPQMLGLESLGALSFDKGCYPGQEIVARTHYRGRVKRHLRVMSARCADPPGPGVALIGGADGARVGEVIDAARHREPDRTVIAAVIADDATAVCLDAPGHPPLEPFEG